MTWVSTTEYYKLINQKVNQRLGGQHSAKMLISSVDFAEVMSYLLDEDWQKVENLLLEKAEELKSAGANFIAISSNTMAKVGKSISQKSGLELIDIFNSTALEINKLGLKKVLLLGTGFTMKDPYFIEELKKNNVKAIVPSNNEIELIDKIIFTELTKEIITKKSKNTFIEIIERLKSEEGIDGVILGCTEIPLLIKASDSSVPIFDTTEIHTSYIVEYSLAKTL